MKIGYIYSIISAILFGCAGLVLKFAYVEKIGPVELLTLQYIIAVSVMFIILYIKNKGLPKLSKSNLIHLCILGVIGNTFMTIFYYTAYQYLTMSMVTILLYTYPIMVFLYSLIFEKIKIKLAKLVALIFAFIGCILALNLLNGNVKYSSKGIIFGLLSAAFYAFMNIYSEKRLTHIDSFSINAYSTLFSLISLILYKFPGFIFKGEVTETTFICTVILAVFCEIIPLTLMYAAIKHIGSLKVSIIGNLETPTAMLLSFLVLRESISFVQVIGAILIFCAVYIIRK
ncbi:DMT family transporter [Candidatus Clostridium radicumherbarum]|uniref:DMT family transporter n=1 Tax=Candidatus Clostridium radicumherbarum TaxID=3381662 RepID=A0ABW8TQX5_9CLOT